MIEYDPLSVYPAPKEPRLVGIGQRSIKNKLIASKRDEEFFDGERCNGYGGFKYDGRWKIVAEKFQQDYDLAEDSHVLHLACEKAFLLHDFKSLFPKMTVHGTEASSYAIGNSMNDVRSSLVHSDIVELPFADNSMDLVICMGATYCLNLEDIIRHVKEVERVSKTGGGFLMLAAYETEEEYWLFKEWSLLGATYLKPEEWKEVLKHCGYSGRYTLLELGD